MAGMSRFVITASLLSLWGVTQATALARFSSVALRQPFRHGSNAGQSMSSPFSYGKLSTRRRVFEVPVSETEQVSTQDLLDRLLDESLRMNARRHIMIQFDPSSKAIWRHWKGTIFDETWKSSAVKMIWAIAVYFLFKKCPGLTETFGGFDTLWAQLLSATTFTLTFFVNQAFNVWYTTLNICRTIQGHVNDLGMALAGNAKRVDAVEKDGSSHYTIQSRQVLEVVARYIRLFSLLTFASCTRSHRPILTPSGMRRMVSRGLMTKKERSVLINSSVSATMRHNAILMWIYRTVVEAHEAGHLEGGPAFRHSTMQTIQGIRSQANYIESALKGRMPFAYAHIVQVMVDGMLWMYPIMAFSSNMSFTVGVFGTVVLTTCYQGLFDLSKQFLDPFHNENFWKGDDPLVVDTMIAENNAGSVRWMNALEDMPIQYRDTRDGNLEAFILPDDGYSIEEADAFEELLRAEKEDKKPSATRSIYGEDLSSNDDMLQDAEEELEETKLILNSPPGLDFVPGLDDDDDDLAAYYSRNTTTTRGPPDIDGNTGDKFLDAAEEEYNEVKGMQDNMVGTNGESANGDSSNGLRP